MILRFQLKRLLEHRGISSAELSRRAGVPKQSISDWLSGVEPRKLSHVRRVAQVLGITLDELCFGGPTLEKAATSSKPSSGSNESLRVLLDEEVYEVRIRKLG